MDRNLIYLCGHCKQTCGFNSAKCDNCMTWFHAKCEKLSPKDMRILISAKSGYVCGTCAGSDYRASLMRISQAAKCYSYLEKAVKRESVIMRDPFIVTDELPTTHVYFQRSTDIVSSRLQEKFGFVPERRPLSVSGDGNCLFNAVSVAICGAERYADELRVRTVIEMVMNAEKYKSSPSAKTYLTLAPNYKDACVECGRNGAYSSVWTIVALTSVIGRPIHSVYPPCNGTDGSNGFIVRSLNTTFLPDTNCKFEPIYIMWTSTTPKPRKGLWSPNHFVPLLALTDCPGIASVPQTDFSSQSPNYRQEFPDLASSMVTSRTLNRQKIPKLAKQKYSKRRKYEQSEIHDPSSSSDRVKSPKRQKLSPLQNKNNKKVPEQDFQDLSSSFEECSQPPKQQKKSIEKSSQLINLMDISPLQTGSTPAICKGSRLPKNSTPINTDTFLLEENNSDDFIDYGSISDIQVTAEKATKDWSSEQIKNKEDEQANASSQESQSELNQCLSVPSLEGDNESASDQTEIPEGGFVLRKNLTTKELYRQITTSKFSLPQIPTGIKSNCFFLVDNKENMRRLEKNDNATYFDDCGVWNFRMTRTVELTYLLKDGNLRYIKKDKENYCVKKVKSKTVTWVPLEPQPDDDDIVILHKYYTTLKRSPDYSKHVSWFSKLPVQFQHKVSIAVVEYSGDFPVNKLSVHGNNKTENKEYKRTHPEIKDAIKQQLKQNVPVCKILKDLTNANPEKAPRDHQVIENLKRQERKQTAQTNPGDSLADEILQVFKLLRTHPFVQQVNSTKSHAPTIILYSEEQMEDFQFFLSKNTDYVVGVDRTFNLGATYVTCFAYKNLRVQRPRTRDHPVFFGPMYLHWDGTFESYHYFFSHIRGRLSTPIGNTELQVGDSFKIGSDDEKALTKALDLSFPASERYLCTKHMKDNLSHFLMRKEEMTEMQKNRIVAEIFAPGGLVDADDSFTFEELSLKLKTQYQRYEPFIKYFEGSLKSRSLKHVNRHRRQNGQKQPLWTNNACESLNAVLKRDIDWKPQKIPVLIETLYAAVNFQMNSLRASLSGTGIYNLAPGYGHYMLPSVVWGSKSQEEKQRLFINFLLDKKRRVPNKAVKAKNVSFEVPNEQKLARKIGQKNKRTKTTKKYYRFKTVPNN